MRVAIFASGRGSNFDALLAATRAPGHPAEIALLVSDRADAPVLERAAAADLPVFTFDPGTRRGPWSPAGVDAVRRALAEHRIEAICLAGFMRILPPEILRLHPHRILNIHPSLLPEFPGLRAQRQAIRAGAKVSGCTVHFVDEGVDTGPILAQRKVDVLPDDTPDSLASRILVEEHALYPEVLCALAEDRIRVEGGAARILEKPEPSEASPR